MKGLHIAENRGFFFLSLISPLIFYIITIFQFPPLDNPEKRDLKKHFDAVRSYNYGCFIMLLCSFYINDYFLQDAPASDYIMTSIAMVLAVTGIAVKKRWVDLIIISLGIATMIGHILTLRSFDRSDYVIDNFTVTEYLTIFTAFIYGAVATKFFSGWGTLVYNKQKLILNKEYFAWTILVFGLLIDFWWGHWDRQAYVSQNIGKFIFSLTTPVMCYFRSVVVFPTRKIEIENLGDFFSKNKHVVFLLLGLILLTNFMIANLMEKKKMLSGVNILRVTAVVMAIAEGHIRREQPTESKSCFRGIVYNRQWCDPPFERRNYGFLTRTRPKPSGTSTLQ